MLTAAVILILLVSPSFSDYSDSIGLCDRNFCTGCLDFDKFATESNGSWCEVRVPKTELTENLKSLSYELVPTNTKGNAYNLTMEYVTINGSRGMYTEEMMTYLGNGIAVSKGSSFTLYVIIIKYEPGVYAYYFLCSLEGSDTSVAQRYVLAHGPLSETYENEIKEMDTKYNFDGEVISLSTC